MAFQQFVDSLPIAGIFVLFTGAALLATESGYHLGSWWQRRTPEEKEGPTPMIVGSLLALMAFLLAITMSMASDRFDARRAIVLDEANAVGTTYLRAGYLASPEMYKIKRLLREYVPLRITTSHQVDLEQRIERSVQIQTELWAITETLARRTPESDVLSLYIDSLNEVIDLHQKRVTANLYGRVPATILLLLLVGSLLTLAMVGYSAGLNHKRSPFTSIVQVLVLSAVITLVFDLDRPQDGFLEVSLQPLIDLQHMIEPEADVTPR